MKRLQIGLLSFFLFHAHLCFCQVNSGMLEKVDTLFKTAEGVTIKAESGNLKVPENRAVKNSRLISVKYVRLKSLSSAPKEPLIFLAGGPGNTCTGQAADPEELSEWMSYLRISDVILYDQRGTDNENLVWYWDSPYPEDFLVSSKSAGEHYKIMGRKSLAAFKERGIDITGYTTTESAHDIEELRVALKIDKISILGFSYGTQLGLALINLYGTHIKNAVLAGVEGLDDTFDYPLLLDTHFKKLAKMCAHDKQIYKDVPDLVRLMEQVMKKLDEKPIEVTVSDPFTGKPLNVKVGSFGLALILRLDMGDASDIPVIPRLIFSIDKGDPTLLKWFVQKRITLAYGIPGMSVMMDIASGVSENRRKTIDNETAKSLFKNVANFPFYDLMEVWPAVVPGFDFTMPIVSDVRTLLISGELDYNTPPFQAEVIKWGLSNATHLVVKNAGHEQTLSDKKIKQAISGFLGGEDVGTVLASYKKLKFIPVTGNSTMLSHPSIIIENKK